MNYILRSSVLVTGGAGFIGSRLCQELYKLGYDVIVYDNLSEQVHGSKGELPSNIKDKVQFIKGDIRDRELLKKVIAKVDMIVHLASETGVGQSMYLVEKYLDVIVRGTGVLWDVLTNEKNNVKKVVLSSSRAVYGEGSYQCINCGIVYPESRQEEALRKAQWGLKCPHCGEALLVCPTDENALLKPVSIYAIGKRTQEDICMVMGKALKIPVSILRYQNVYGPGQSLNNPYTGILSIFTSKIKSGKCIQVYEDGNESRDFVHVNDVVQGTLRALESHKADYNIFNIGSGIRTTVLEIAQLITQYINPSLSPVITGKYRVGDIRHCYADISKAKNLLGYDPQVRIDQGIIDFLSWTDSESYSDLSETAERELEIRGLFK